MPRAEQHGIRYGKETGTKVRLLLAVAVTHTRLQVVLFCPTSQAEY